MKKRTGMIEPQKSFRFHHTHKIMKKERKKKKTNTPAHHHQEAESISSD